MNGIFTAQRIKLAGAAGGFVLLLICFASSVLLGSTTIDWRTAKSAIVQYDKTDSNQVIVRTARLPRAVTAVGVGASLAIAGALMQALTRNPLASPSVLGVNAGATFFIVLSITFFSFKNMQSLMWVAFVGAAVGSVVVYMLGSLGRGGLTPLKIILAGSAMTALFSSFTQGMLVLNQTGFQSVIFWLTGSISRQEMNAVALVLPYMAAGWVAALLVARQINLFMLGEDSAAGLGQRTGLIKIAAGAIIVVLAGASVSIAGPIALIGVMIPHIGRYLVGNDYRWLVPYCGLLGAVLLLIADIAARFIVIPEEMPVGVMTAAIGAPFFIYLARRELSQREAAR
ncbi:iron ABC transporter permease [Paenibacillus sp. NEAU-GSW1]|uniref:FecCD family ABC transporter permease n=1 Tax=Paenibacillus sp. NEAU-GSW1 TaxID=2682486 RepID=UPI0012E22E71|nr:iron ABC transporter permease [Paenibacillus sp. NEAU-GSW1]MUT67214.1 iron chelate uptake ABC transporter family permease subunit [Paenibacillus sp. NEAU-GSW1]